MREHKTEPHLNSTTETGHRNSNIDTKLPTTVDCSTPASSSCNLSLSSPLPRCHEQHQVHIPPDKSFTRRGLTGKRINHNVSGDNVN